MIVFPEGSEGSAVKMAAFVVVGVHNVVSVQVQQKSAYVFVQPLSGIHYKDKVSEKLKAAICKVAGA